MLQPPKKSFEDEPSMKDVHTSATATEDDKCDVPQPPKNSLEDEPLVPAVKHEDNMHSSEDSTAPDEELPHPSKVWSKQANYIVEDHYGYNRIPAFWFTLNLAFNYLYEIHRFQRATEELSSALHQPDDESQQGEQDPDGEMSDVDCLDPVRRDAMGKRCNWVLNNPDIVVTLHAIRVELLIKYVMAHVVKQEDALPFLYWLRFEFGQSGNPHAHGLAYVAGNPQFDLIAKDEATYKELLDKCHPDMADIQLAENAQRDVADFYNPYVREMHPCKDTAGKPLWFFDEPLYTLMVENVPMPGCAKPQTINLLELLEGVFSTPDKPDTSRLKYLLLALVENGQRHDYHDHDPPKLGTHACARKGKNFDGKEIVYCRYLFPREMQNFDGDVKGCIMEDPFRPDLRNLCLQRNDCLINSFEEHLLLMNLGNIDWRPLLNLWTVLEYLTKYTAKAGKGSKHLGKLFEDVLDKVFQFEMEDGIHDMWRRTIMKFYSRILGDRDYSLFEVLHFGLRLPGVLSSFDDVQKASVSNWSSVKSNRSVAQLKPEERVTNLSALEIFNSRGMLERPARLREESLHALSFYAFSRMFDVVRGKIVQKRKEKMVALTGNGWPAQAKRSHEKHSEYAKKTLYAYMPCPGLAGTEYIDAVVRRDYQNSYARMLAAFVRDRNNCWCPKWIRRNYEIQNKETDDAIAPVTISDAPEKSPTPNEAETEKFPHSSKYTQKFIFDPPGEPPNPEDPERPESYTSDHHWRPENRESWQRHSEKGPNVDPEGHLTKPPPPLEHLVNPTSPPLGREYDRHWQTKNFDARRACEVWEKLREEKTIYSDESLSRDTLNDDYQQLFVTMLIDHVHHIVDCIKKRKRPEPMRLLLLGTAGSGKTRSVQTALQEMQRALAQAELPVDVDSANFVRVGAPTGSAAFNLRFQATTIHRLIHWYTPPYFREIQNAESLQRLQKDLEHTQLLILDEMSMIGRQMMGRIDSRMEQAKAGIATPDAALGGVSCVLVGDPAQCEAIMDQQIYDTTPHRDTTTDMGKQSVTLSNRGLDVYSNFTKVIVLTKTHRLTMIEDPKTKEEVAFNERAERFVQVLRRLRDCDWTCEDYYWLCRRKRSQLSYAERARFADAPVIMDFRRTTEENPEENCDAYNKAHLRAMAHKEHLPVIRIDAQHTGIPQDEGMKLGEERFNGLAAQVEYVEGAPVILIHNIAVEQALMNGAQGVIQQIIFEKGHHPNHDNPMKRVPRAIVVDFPKYAGPAFYDEPERATWVPVEMRERKQEGNEGVTRRQFPLILGWAMTPWKAQGMTLDRAVVRLTKAASSPGVAFVALSRVRHPDHLMLDDSFPDMSTIMKQADKESFRMRQRWESRMRVYFSKTVREYMRDPELFTPEKTWTHAQSAMAEQLLRTLRSTPDLEDDAVVANCCKENGIESRDEVEQVWAKLNTFPHVFEIANARGELANYDLNGCRREGNTISIQHVSYRQWKVSLIEYDELLEKGSLEPSMMELLMNFLRPHLPRDIFIKQPFALRSKKTGLEHLPKNAKPRVQVFPYRSNSKTWAFYLLIENDDGYTLQVVTPKKYAAEAFEWATKHLQFQYNITHEVTYLDWPSDQGSELLFMIGLLRALFPDTSITQDQEKSYVIEALSFLRELREIAGKSNEASVDMLLEEHLDLGTKAFQLAKNLIPTSQATRDSFRGRGEKTSGVIPLPKKLHERTKPSDGETDDKVSGRIPQPKRLRASPTIQQTIAASTDKLNMPGEQTPAVREVDRDPQMPTLKRRRVPPLTPNVAEHTSQKLDEPRQTSASSTEPMIRRATEEEAEKKRRLLNEPEHVEEVDMDELENSSHNMTDAKKPFSHDATTEETTKKRHAANESDHVKKYDLEDSTSGKKLRREGGTESSSGSKHKGNDDVARDKAAAAATTRAEHARRRGVGNLQTLAELEAETAKQEAKGTRDCFGAEAAAKLRKQLAATHSASSSSGQQTHTPDSAMSSRTSATTSATRKTRAYAPTLRQGHVNANLARYFTSQGNEPVSLTTLDAGGGGDCLFHSVAAIAEKILFETRDGANRFEPHLKLEDFLRGKSYVVSKLRTLVADELINLQPEVFLNIIVSSMNQESIGNWQDAWSPSLELHRAGFGFLVKGKANIVEAVGENEDGATGDMLVQYNNGRNPVVHVLSNGAVQLIQLQENIRAIWRTPGNTHWGTVTDAERLSSTLRLGLVIFSSEGQRRVEGNHSWIYGTSMEDATFDYWGLVYCMNNQHFQVTEAAPVGSTSRSAYFRREDLPMSILAHYNICNNSCPVGTSILGRVI